MWLRRMVDCGFECVVGGLIDGRMIWSNYLEDNDVVFHRDGERIYEQPVRISDDSCEDGPTDQSRLQVWTYRFEHP